MKSIVYIDGQNFLYKASEVLIKNNVISDKQELTALNIRGIFEQLFPNDELEIRYYGVTKIRRRPDYGQEIYNKSVKFSDNLRRVRRCLEKQGVAYIPVGKLNIRNSDVCKFCGKYDYRYQEKGVDVGLAVDIVKDTLKNRTDKIILASSDTDLVPAILTAMEEGKEVVYAGFGDKLTHALVAKTSSTQTIPDTAIIEAYNSAVN